MSNDDIVTRLRSKYGGQLPICAEAADEIERLRLALAELANRHSAQEAKHYRIIRSLEAECDQWQRMAVRGEQKQS